MDLKNEEFIKREQSDDLLFEAYEEPIKTKAIKLAKQALELNPNNQKYYDKLEIIECKKQNIPVDDKLLKKRETYKNISSQLVKITFCHNLAVLPLPSLNG